MRVLCAFCIEQCCEEGGADDFRIRYRVKRGDVGAVHHARPLGCHRPCLWLRRCCCFSKLESSDAGAHQHVNVHPPCGHHGGACRVGHASWEPGECSVRVSARRLQPSFERNCQRGGLVGVQRPVLAVFVFGQALCMAAAAAADDDRGNGRRVRDDGVPCVFCDTIVTWSLPTVPISLWLNALVGGPLLTAITLYAAQWRALAGRFGLLLMAVSFIALAANAVVYIVQGRLLGGVANSVVAATGLVPHYRAMLLTFALMCFAGCVLAALTMHAVCRGKRWRTAGVGSRSPNACLLAWL